MTEPVNSLSIEVAMKDELVAFQERLAGATKNLLATHRNLQQNPADFLVRAKNLSGDNESELRDHARNFVILRRPQLTELVRMSYILGIPLSPVGLMTFTSAELTKMTISLQGFAKYQDVGGIAIEPRFFNREPLSQMGIWLIHSPAAADYSFAEEERLLEEMSAKRNEPDEQRDRVIESYKSPVVPVKQFKPTRADILHMREYYDHEAFHGTHFSMINFEGLDRFNVTLLKEGLAFRTGYLLGLRTPDEIKDKLRGYYGMLNNDQVNKINDFVDVCVASKDPNYQRELTWRGIYSVNVSDFIQPPIEIEFMAKSMAQYSADEVIPSFEKELLGQIG